MRYNGITIVIPQCNEQGIHLQGVSMTLKPVTLQLNEGEYEKLKEYLSEFGDPDISIEVVIRSYIRNLNRAMPLALRSNYDGKHYFRLISAWLKHFDFMFDHEMFSKTMGNPSYFWQWMHSPFWLETKKSEEPENTSKHQYQH